MKAASCVINLKGCKSYISPCFYMHSKYSNYTFNFRTSFSLYTRDLDLLNKAIVPLANKTIKFKIQHFMETESNIVLLKML